MVMKSITLEEYEKARKDLSASQMIDYDDSAAEALKFVTEKVAEIESEKVKKKVEVSYKYIFQKDQDGIFIYIYIE